MQIQCSTAIQMKSNGRKALALRFSCYTNVTKILLLSYGRFSLAASAEGLFFLPHRSRSLIHTWVAFYAHPQQHELKHCKSLCSLCKAFKHPAQVCPPQCRALTLRSGPRPDCRLIGLDPLNTSIRRDMPSWFKNDTFFRIFFFLVIICNAMLSEEAQ